MANKNLNQIVRFMLVLFFALAGLIPSHSAHAVGTGTISGVLYMDDGVTPVTNFLVQVRAVMKSDGSQVASTFSTQADGSYMLTVPSGTDLLVVASDENPDTDGYGAVYWGQPDLAFLRTIAFTFNLADGASVTGVNFTLPPSRPAPAIEHLTFNVSTGHILADKRIRQAIAYGADRERILNEAFLGIVGNYGVTLNSLVAPGYWSQPAYNNVTIYPYNPAQANAILDAAGMKDTNSDGIREIDGVEIVLDFISTDTSQRGTSSAIFYENMLAIGIGVNVNLVQEGVFYEASGRLRTGAFDIAEFAWGPTTLATLGVTNISDLNMDDAYPLTVYQIGNPLNFGGYGNTAADAQVAAALAETSRETMLPYVLEYYAITTDDLPSLPLFTRGFVQLDPTPSGENVPVDLNTQGISVLYQNVTTDGITGGYHSTAETPIHLGDLPANETLQALYEIGSSVGMSAGTGATVCVDYPQLEFLADEEKLQLYHLTMNGTRTWTNIFISRNTTDNKICGFTKSFSTFVVLLPTNPLPAAFTKTSPGDHAVNQPLNVTFSWSTPDVPSYEMCYDTTNNNLCDDHWVDMGHTVSTDIALTKYGTTYYWGVRARNTEGDFTYADNGVWHSFTTAPITLTKNSSATQDGWILESSEKSSKGGTKNNTAANFNIGDNASNKQYRVILHFDTTALPANAVVTSATLRIKKQKIVGKNPFTTHGPLLVDIRKPYFGTTSGLVVSDFQATATSAAVASFGAPDGSWYSAILNSAGIANINRGGMTQFRLRFTKDDNNDHGADYVMFYSGSSSAANRPQLIIQYYMP